MPLWWDVVLAISHAVYLETYRRNKIYWKYIYKISLRSRCFLLDHCLKLYGSSFSSEHWSGGMSGYIPLPAAPYCFPPIAKCAVNKWPVARRTRPHLSPLLLCRQPSSPRSPLNRRMRDLNVLSVFGLVMNPMAPSDCAWFNLWR